MKTAKTKIIGGNAKVVRSINRATILNLIRTHQPISRASIARSTGLNKSTVSSIVNDLINESLINEQEIQDQNVGRNPIQLTLKSGMHFVGAINIDSSISRVAIFDINGAAVIKEAFPSDTSEKPDRLLNTTASLLREIQHKMNIDHLKGIGVSVAGIVDKSREVVRVAPNLHWYDIEIGKFFRQAFPEQNNFSFENDAKASALAELWFGTGKITQFNDFVFLSVGVGIGAGIVVGRKLLDGSNHSAGEFGHTIISENGRKCNCGNRGCLEVFASDRSTVQRYHELKNDSRNTGMETILNDVIDRARENDEHALQSLKETGRYLGIGISTIAKAIDPQAVVIGGKIIQAWDIIYPEIKKRNRNMICFICSVPLKFYPVLCRNVHDLSVRQHFQSGSCFRIIKLCAEFSL